MKAGELWALSQGKRCGGECRCHWCGAACDPGTAHDDLPPVPFVKSKGKALCPASPWVCVGCDLFRRKRRTIHFLEGGFRDSQAPQDWGWFVSDLAKALRPDSSHALYGALLSPPRRFCLALLDPATRTKNQLHLWIVNETEKTWGAEEAISFTVDNAPFIYSPYELRTALSSKKAQMSPGVRALLRLFGPYPPLDAKKAEPERQAEPTYHERGPRNPLPKAAKSPGK